MTISYFGDNLYSLRKKMSISQDELAEKLGVSRQAVSKWERNEAYPDTDNLIAIAKFFNVSIDDLINSRIEERGASDGNEDAETQIDALENDGDKEDGDDVKVEDERSDSGITIVGKKVPVAIIAVIVYMLLGFFIDRGWEVGWTVFLLIPVYYSITDCISQKRISSFLYPVFISFVFLLFGMIYNIWHPLWVVYLTIPIFYSIAEAIDKYNKNKKK